MIRVSDQIQRLLKIYAEGISGIYDKDLKSILLYGSYARGDFREDSDMDIMILVNLSEEEIQKTRRKVSDYTYDFYVISKEETEEQLKDAEEIVAAIGQYLESLD